MTGKRDPRRRGDFEEQPTGRIQPLGETRPLTDLPQSAGGPHPSQAFGQPAAPAGQTVAFSQQETGPLAPVGAFASGEFFDAQLEDEPDGQETTQALDEEGLTADGLAVLEVGLDEGDGDFDAPEAHGDPFEGEGEIQDQEPPAPRRRFRLRTWHVVGFFVVVIMAAIITLTSLFVWDRWYRFDDSEDLQGVWYVIGTDVPITITADQIRFTSDTAYSYTIDEESKSITYSLGNLDGSGHYTFKDDRQVLILTDGEGYSRWGTAQEDLLKLFMDFADLSAGKAIHLPEGEGVIVLCRAPFYGDHVQASQDDQGEPAASGSGSAASPSASNGLSGGSNGSSNGDDPSASAQPTEPSRDSSAEPQDDSGASRGKDLFDSVNDRA